MIHGLLDKGTNLKNWTKMQTLLTYLLFALIVLFAFTQLIMMIGEATHLSVLITNKKDFVVWNLQRKMQSRY